MKVSLDSLEKYAHNFVQTLSTQTGDRACVVGLKGNLGAGKTTFVQAVARALGVVTQVTSPTFVIAQTYDTAHPIFKKLIHIDGYRLLGETGDTIGFRGYLSNAENLVMVEWPENLPPEIDFPKGVPILEFETINETTRKIVLAS